MKTNKNKQERVIDYQPLSPQSLVTGICCNNIVASRKLINCLNISRKKYLTAVAQWHCQSPDRKTFLLLIYVFLGNYCTETHRMF